MTAKIKFAVTGLNHGHIYGQTETMLATGAEAACFYAPEDNLAEQFVRTFPAIPRVGTLAEIVSAQVANFHHPQFPELEDFGDAVVRGDGNPACTGC